MAAAWRFPSRPWRPRIDSLLSLSSLLAARRRWQEALDVDRRCVALCWRHWHRHGLACALWNPPRALAHLRQPGDAIRLMAFAATFWVTTFGPLAQADRRTVRLVRGLVRAQLGAALTETLWIEGASMDIRQAVALALRAPAADREEPGQVAAAMPSSAQAAPP